MAKANVTYRSNRGGYEATLYSPRGTVGVFLFARARAIEAIAIETTPTGPYSGKENRPGHLQSAPLRDSHFVGDVTRTAPKGLKVRVGNTAPYAKFVHQGRRGFKATTESGHLRYLDVSLGRWVNPTKVKAMKGRPWLANAVATARATGQRIGRAKPRIRSR